MNWCRGFLIWWQVATWSWRQPNYLDLPGPGVPQAPKAPKPVLDAAIRRRLAK